MHLIKMTPTLSINPEAVESIREGRGEHSAFDVQTIITMRSGSQHVFSNVPIEDVMNRVLGRNEDGSLNVGE